MLSINEIPNLKINQFYKNFCKNGLLILFKPIILPNPNNDQIDFNLGWSVKNSNFWMIEYLRKFRIIFKWNKKNQETQNIKSISRIQIMEL